jgi:ferritin-like metal-binding protein YciE
LMAISISLESLQEGFDKYKNEATSQIRQLETTIRFHKAVNVTLSIGIVAGGTYLLGDKLGWW